MCLTSKICHINVPYTCNIVDPYVHEINRYAFKVICEELNIQHTYNGYQHVHDSEYNWYSSWRIQCSQQQLTLLLLRTGATIRHEWDDI
jgi:hypothetical protein